MKHSFHIAIAALSAVFSLTTQAAWAQAAAEPRQDLAVLKQTAEQFLLTQANGLPGEVRVTVGAIDPRLKLPVCPVPEAFLPPSSKAWGKTTVGVRCNVPSAWTIYVSAQVRVHGEYIAAAAPLAQGQTIGQGDICILYTSPNPRD